MIVFYDLETTGLLHPSRKDLPGIIEIAAVKYTNEGEKAGAFHSLVDPELLKCDWEAGAVKTTGVSIDDIEKVLPVSTRLRVILQLGWWAWNVLRGTTSPTSTTKCFIVSSSDTGGILIFLGPRKGLK